MRTFAIPLLALCLSAGVARAQSDEEMGWAVGQVGEELQMCSVYFSVVSGCMGLQRPDLAESSLQAAMRLALLGASSKQSVGVSQEAYLAFSDVLLQNMKKLMGGNCTNVAVLLQRYSNFCQRLSQDADPRLKEWIACFRAHRQTCDGPTLP